MLALIDGDILRYRLGFATQHTDITMSDGAVVRGKRDANKHMKDFEGTYIISEELIVEPIENALYLVQESLKTIALRTDCKKPKIYLSGKNNFRETLYPNYKASRKDSVRPVHYNAIGTYLVEEHGAIIVDGMEADDALAIAQTIGANTIICSIDKDLLQVPGEHYDFVKDEFITVSEEEALFNLYTQILTGDATDDIPGLKGIGPVKAQKALAHCETERDYYETALSMWECAGHTEEEMNLSASLLYLLREPDDKWGKLFGNIKDEEWTDGQEDNLIH